MNKFMKEANKLAQENIKNKNGGPFGAVIVKDDEIIGRGSNHVLKNNDPTAHAEIMAIREACHNLNTYDLTGCDIYTSCYPCPMCLSAIIWANIKNVYYGNTKEDAEQIGFIDKKIYNYIDALNDNEEDNSLNLVELDRNETIKTFQEFSKDEDKIIY